MKATTSGASSYRLKAHDLSWFILSALFALFSLAWPDTGELRIGEATISRGYPLAVVYALIAALCVLAPFIESRLSRIIVSKRKLDFVAFLRTYYPQATVALFFTDAILLSARAFGGLPHDALFEKADQAIFGFQPAREFYRALGAYAWINEIMFAAYFMYFFFMITAIWIPFLKGNRAEGERQLFAIATTALLVFTWYVFFRVEGPKYWLPDLKAAWYDEIKGGFFVNLFKTSLAKATLSGAAFPSTHVILTLTTLIMSYKNDRRFFAIYAPVAILILCATVYIFAHWVTDIIGGMIVAALLPPLFYRIYPSADAFAGRLSTCLAASSTGRMRSRVATKR